MKFLFVMMTCFMSLSAFADANTARVDSSSSPGNGDNRVTGCEPEYFGIKIQPYCFGTNLRGYSADVQMKFDKDLLLNIKVADDRIDVKFPASLTFAPLSTRKICLAEITNPAQDMVSPGPAIRTFKCNLGKNKSNVIYKVTDWRGTTNPSCIYDGGGLGPEYCNYAARPLQATTLSTDVPDSMKDIVCLYSFDAAWKMKPEISCAFNARNEPQDDKVSVVINGKTQKFPNSDLNAYYNNIAMCIPLSDLPSINKLSGPAADAAGIMVRAMPIFSTAENAPVAPTPTVEYFQIDDPIKNVLRPLEKKVNPLGATYEMPDKVNTLDEVNNNMSLRIVSKFPGEDGLCGGYYSPLMLFFNEKIPKFTGVSLFPLHGVKKGGRVNWPEANHTGYFLASLQNGEKEITKATQLFGQDGINDNGFESLKVHDLDKNGVINNKDKIWKALRLWKDENSNGISEKEEIHSLGSRGVQSIDLKYESRGMHKVGDRARIRERSNFTYKSKGKKISGEIIDVWLSPID